MFFLLSLCFFFVAGVPTCVKRYTVRYGRKSASPRLAKVFDGVSESKQAAFIPYLTAGYPKKADTVGLLLALQVQKYEIRV